MGFRMEKKNQMSREKGLIKTKDDTAVTARSISAIYIYCSSAGRINMFMCFDAGFFIPPQ